MNEGFGKDSYRQGNPVKRFGPFTEPPDSERPEKLVCPHSLPENQLLDWARPTRNSPLFELSSTPGWAGSCN